MSRMQRTSKRFYDADWGQRWIGLFDLLMGLGTATTAWSGDDHLVQRMLAGGEVLLIRHAAAPGTGDPEGFRLGDCTTQRNLSDTGRKQARAIGDWLRDQGIERARVYSSQWCRCLETAELLDLGPVVELPGLNSFYERPQDREPNLAAIRDFLKARPPREGLLILVTHQVLRFRVVGE